MSALTAVEAARAAVVLEDTAARLTFLSAITPALESQSSEVAALVGDEVARIIADQRALEARYDVLIELRAGLKGVANKARFREVQAEVVEVSGRLRESVKALTRALKDNPDVGDGLARIAEERDSIHSLLMRTLADVREGHFRTVAEFVAAEEATRARLAAVASREAATTKEVDALAATLKEEEDRHAYDMETKRAEIALLKDRLRKLKAGTALTIRYARKDAAAKNEALARGYSVDEVDAAKAVEELKAKLATENAAHEVAMDLLKREQDEYLRRVEAVKATAAADLAAKAEELRALTERRDAQRVLLEALQDRYEADLQVMVDKMADAECRRQDIEAAAIEEARRKVAATSLQKILGDMFTTVKAVAEVNAAKKGGGKKK